MKVWPFDMWKELLHRRPILNAVLRHLKRDPLLLELWLNYQKYYSWAQYTGFRRERRRIARITGREPNIFDPKTLSDKIVWKKLYDRDSLLVQTSDKYAVRDYVRKKLGARADALLIPLLAVTDKPEKLPLSELEPPYVIKATHGCSTNLFVHQQMGDGRFRVSKESTGTFVVDSRWIVRQCKIWLNTRYGYKSHQWAYLQIPPRLIVEPLLRSQDGGKIPAVKLYCFHGRPVYTSYVEYGEKGSLISFFEADGGHIDAEYRGHKQASIEHLELDSTLTDVAERLSEGFEFVRVDLYLVDGEIKFSELTHYPASGAVCFKPSSFDCVMGQHWRVEHEEHNTSLAAEGRKDRAVTS